ncbi:hypothetical protein GCM10010520_41380 [Rhizobium viscosum]|uniref:Uncharacterized protein n=1 Tax=Rhizobium viscosum TaxID=1673 RepID=A0ABR9IPG9_RHIVS|nr:hypothetical protein [Rhizobium viscosum]MBE1505092.1 hypothetical protein [Rhizobium viscosum]
MNREVFQLAHSPYLRNNEFEGATEPREKTRGISRNVEVADLYSQIIGEIISVILPTLGVLVPPLKSLMTQVQSALKSTTSPPPRIYPDRVITFQMKLQEQFQTRGGNRKDVGLAIIAALLVQLRNIVNLDDEQISDEVRFEMWSYTSWLNIVENDNLTKNNITALEELGTRYTDTLAALEECHKNAVAELDARLAEFNTRGLDLQSRDVRIRESLDKATTQVEELFAATAKRTEAESTELRKLDEEISKLDAKVVTNATNISAFKTAVQEEVRGAETRKLWQNRDEEAWNAFAISTGILAILLVIVPVIGLWQLDWVIGVLRHIGEATTVGIPATESGTLLTVATISRLVVVTFPLVLYLWVIRLIVRFNTRSLTLHDDARQRQTMMDTYFILLERNAATTEERGLILNALFRPAPGQGPENLDPPSFTDFLGKANPIK